MSSTRNEMINGVFWTAIEKYSGLVVSILVTAVMARLLSPAEFGVVAIATVLIHFLSIFATMGIGPAIIQKQDLSARDVDVIYTFSLCVGFFLTLLFFASSWAIASFYENQQLVTICQILSLNLFFASANMVPSALMSKNKRFKEIAKRTVFLQISTGLVSILAAYIGAGVYTLLISPIITAVGVYLYNTHFYPVHLAKLKKEPIRKIASFSIYQFAFSVSNYFTRNLDKLIIGKYYSMNELGYYEKSYRLMMLPLQQVTHILTPVMHPVLAQLQNDYASLARDYRKILNILSIVSFPLGAFLFFAADNLIYIIYGEQWMAAVPVFEILSISVPLQMLIATTGGIYQSSGRTDWLFWAGLFHASITVVGFLVASIVLNSIEAIAWAFVITLCLHTFLSLMVVFSIILKHKAMPIFKDMLIPAVAAMFQSIGLYLLDLYINFHFLSLALQLILSLAIVLPIYQMTGRVNLVKIYKRFISKK